MTNDASTPLMRQYTAIKKEHPNSLLFFRLGDFYELFFDDAVTAARELQITLTSRNKEKGIAVPMCGVPYHAADGYITKLIRRGFKVAICDQMEDAKKAVKLVRREVTREMTPGTAAGSLLGSEENNFLAALVRLDSDAKPAAGFAALDLSTGEFRATEFQGGDAERRVLEELEQLRPREVLYASSTPLFDSPVSGGKRRSPGGECIWAETPLEDWVFAPDYALPQLENQFGVLSLEGFGLAGKTAAACAAGAVLHYVRTTQRGSLDHIDRIGFYQRQDCLVLDAVSVRNLELIEPLFAGAGDGVTLFRALDATVTPMGKRLLRAWMLRPSIDREEIDRRLDAVSTLLQTMMTREDLRRGMEGVLDVERLLSRVTLETANARDVLALSASLGKLPGIRATLAKLPGLDDLGIKDPDSVRKPTNPNSETPNPKSARTRLAQLCASIDELRDLSSRIDGTIVPEPPLSFAEGGVIRSGIDATLDELRALSHNSKQFLAQIEERERKRTGINSLKVRFNNVFGYYLEISKPNLPSVPADYERKQTLVNAERFTTPELKEYETKILEAQEKIVEIERRIFTELRTAIAAESRRIRQTALALAEVDVLACFAHLAAHRNYCHPELDASSDIEIVGGRHAVVELPELTGSTDRFVPNDLYMNSGTHAILVLTGPNMGGKSTYLRQSALLVIMAQMGSFVPARKFRLGIVDRIFTRIGASDNLARGRSTFMVEMTETAAILNTATPRSLILLDEVGRGTATYDGLAIAWAAIEYLHARTRAKTLFATHYHELTELAEQLSGVKNFHVSVKEGGRGIVFLRKVEPGAADRSYGIEVAKLAGLPPEVIERARVVLKEHESAERELTSHVVRDELASAHEHVQLTMFTPLSQAVVDRLREADLDRLTPIEALNLLHDLKKQLD
ncbi:MAG: DNA mismatch repair protein MutS [Terriglobales bacterium]